MEESRIILVGKLFHGMVATAGLVRFCKEEGMEEDGRCQQSVLILMAKIMARTLQGDGKNLQEVMESINATEKVINKTKMKCIKMNCKDGLKLVKNGMEGELQKFSNAANIKTCFDYIIHDFSKNKDFEKDYEKNYALGIILYNLLLEESIQNIQGYQERIQTWMKSSNRDNKDIYINEHVVKYLEVESLGKIQDIIDLVF